MELWGTPQEGILSIAPKQITLAGYPPHPPLCLRMIVWWRCNPYLMILILIWRALMANLRPCRHPTTNGQYHRTLEILFLSPQIAASQPNHPGGLNLFPSGLSSSAVVERKLGLILAMPNKPPYFRSPMFYCRLPYPSFRLNSSHSSSLVIGYILIP